MKLQPLGDKVVIESLSREETTKSKLIIPASTDKDKPMQGKVVAVGPGKLVVGNPTMQSGTGDVEGYATLRTSFERIPMIVKVGDHVVFTKYGPAEVTVDNKKYLIINEEYILAVIK